MGALLVGAASVMAQDPNVPAPSGGGWSDLPMGIVGSLIYTILGIIFLVVGYKVLGAVTPFDLNKEIAEDDNVAAGVLVAGMMIGLGIIIAAAIL